MELLERIFHLKENRTNIRTELLAGATTFLTLSYIIFVQPIFMSIAGMDKGAVMTATCISSAIATLVMGLYANYPIALSAGMGHNVYFALVVCGIMKFSWQSALAAVFISGCAFLILSRFGLREKIVNAVPPSLKFAIAAGIGLLITLVGLEWGGIVVDSPGTLLTLGKMTSKPVLVSLVGFAIMAILNARGVKGSILIGLLLTACIGIATGITHLPDRIVALPPSLRPTFFKLDFAALFRGGTIESVLTVVFVFFFLDLFDTVGTLIGIAEKGNFLKEGKLPRARQALFADAVGTVVGALCGTSTITSYVESAAGVSAGGRTGLANMMTAALMLLALFFSPLLSVVGASYPLAKNVLIYPIVAPALIMVGALIMTSVKKINWDDATESIPAFLAMVMMPFSGFSITEGISFGFISYVVLKIYTGRHREVHPIIYFFAACFVFRYAFLLK